MDTLKELYQYREMMFSLVRRELKGRYKGSAFGFLWNFFNPLLQLIVYTIVFSVLFPNNIEKFYIFLFIGLVPWLFFSISLTGGAASIINQQNLIQKIYFPRQVLPIAYVSSEFINMLLSFVVIFFVLIISGFGIEVRCLWMLPIVLVVEYILVLGIAMLTSALTVYFRDLEYILGIFAMLWMYLTPVLYEIEQIQEKLRFLIYLNPMTGIILCYRDILYYKRLPKFSNMGIACGIGIAFFILGCYVFNKLQKRFVEEL
ncbi:MAG: ABC transporter permease [Lachnospiraceae bacterium]|nr:ABC transporter permease [Lachnospiraceae bacterium]